MVPHRREAPGGVLVDPLHRGEAMALVLVSVCMMLVMEGGGGSKLVRVGGGSCYVYTRKRRERGGRATEL